MVTRTFVQSNRAMDPAQSIEPWSNPLTSLCGPLNLFTLGIGNAYGM
jgi:hypothetical protein